MFEDLNALDFIVYISLVVTILLCIVFHVKKLSAYEKLGKEAKKAIELKNANEKLNEINNKLSKYHRIIDIDEAIKGKKIEFNQYIKTEKEKIANLKTKVDEAIRGKKIEFNQYVKTEKEKIEHFKQNAKIEATKYIENANKKAKVIAGDAWDAKTNAKRYKDIAKAMQNQIKGYGDEYIIPNHTTIDDLAEEYSHKEAGEELKKARKRTKELILKNRAADCDYVAPKQRQNACHFVLYAFNGKVDTILSKTKSTNYGKLDAEIQDAFKLVNHNGHVFREARITLDYLEARRNELKWAVAVQELKRQEQEEQKRIRQAMREEEKAMREVEKAIRESEQEEKLLQKAMEKARKELETASEEQRTKFEKELEDLQAKLQDAEEKNQRALSMAQQTKQGHVYVISNIGSFGEKIYKIGLTRRLDPMERVKELGDASVPFNFDVHAMMFHENSPWLESELHNKFRKSELNKINHRKEFFNVSLQDIKDACKEIGIEVRWTMKAEAAEYRESLSLLRESGQVNDEYDIDIYDEEGELEEVYS